MPHPQEIRTAIDAVTAQLKAVGYWDCPQPTDDQIENGGAFGLQTMAFVQWLRWIFVPTVEDRLAQGGPWPAESHVASQAVREFDGEYDADPLIEALRDFDRLF